MRRARCNANERKTTVLPNPAPACSNTAAKSRSAPRAAASMCDGATGAQDAAFMAARGQKKGKKKLDLGFRDLRWMHMELRGKTDSRPSPRQGAPMHYTPFTGVIDGAFWQHFEQLSCEIGALAGTEARLGAVKARLGVVSAAAKKAADAHEANVKKQAARVKLIGQVRPGSAQSHWLKSSFYLQPQLWGKGGPKAKADRQEAKLAKNREEEPALLAAKEASAKDAEFASVFRALTHASDMEAAAIVIGEHMGRGWCDALAGAMEASSHASTKMRMVECICPHIKDFANIEVVFRGLTHASDMSKAAALFGQHCPGGIPGPALVGVLSCTPHSSTKLDIIKAVAGHVYGDTECVIDSLTHASDKEKARELL